MPQAPERRAGFIAYIALTAMCGALLYLLWEHPVETVVVLLAFAVLVAVSSKVGRSRLVLRLAAQGPSNGGICAFARSFDLHQVDPWVVRAVYEEVAAHFKGLGLQVNFKADDDLVVDLGIDLDDLDMDMAANIAARTGRTFDGYKTNPYFAGTNTARGLVMFFNSQPRAA
jgi:hypothetical protein